MVPSDYILRSFSTAESNPPWPCHSSRVFDGQVLIHLKVTSSVGKKCEIGLFEAASGGGEVNAMLFCCAMARGSQTRHSSND